ncbi:ABC transporter ATP-binding protein [bacterium]|nr:ABC transporter ATP-binding protein [bacterium]
MSETLIRLTDIGFRYGQAPLVLDGLSFELGAGERVALLGANGSGKTTLLHLVVGLLRPTAGAIEAFGKMRAAEADFYDVRARAGLLFQDPEDQLFCPTVAEDVAFGPLNLGKSHDEAAAIVAETLEGLGLGGYEDRITYKLSGGEKRLVSLAAVLAMRPEVLLLDEPTAGLDEDAARRLIDVLAPLPQAMLIVSHDRAFREALAGDAHVLRDGRLHAPAAGE